MAVLSREVLRWLQSLDLSFNVRNPKRDFANGWLVAEIISRYHHTEIDMKSYENGSRMAAKVDNWAQLHKLFESVSIPIAKQDTDAVMHCSPGAATAFIYKLYTCLTSRTVQEVSPTVSTAVRPFMRTTAAFRLKDSDIARIEDGVARKEKAVFVLSSYHDERRQQKAVEAELVLQHEKKVKASQVTPGIGTLSQDQVSDMAEIDEVQVRALTFMSSTAPQREAPPANRACSRATQQSAVGALAAMQQPALFVKPAAEIMKPLVMSILHEAEETYKLMDNQSDVVVSFMELSREHVPEEMTVRVFETLGNRAQLLVDTLTKSPPEFWKVWSVFLPALTDFAEIGPVFESAVLLFKRIGELMRESDPSLTQQLMTEVGLPSLVKELVRRPEKRAALCRIIYSYIQEDGLNHLFVLRLLKDKICDLSVYVGCLSCLISLDTQHNSIDSNLLDVYIYYALVAMHSQQPKARVAAIAILSTLVTRTDQHESVLSLLPSFAALTNDDWWEVQAQLLLLAGHLLEKLTAAERQSANQTTDKGLAGAGATDRTVDDDEILLEGGEAPVGHEDRTEGLLDIIERLFAVGSSKNVLQVGLSALVPLLSDHPTFLPTFVTILLEQPAPMRQRLLRPPSPNGTMDEGGSGVTYVMGGVSYMYEEKQIRSLWPNLDIARMFAMQVGVSSVENLESEHVEVFLASLPQQFEENEAMEWLQIFQKVERKIFPTLVNPDLHVDSGEIVKRFWQCPVEQLAAGCILASKESLLNTLHLFYDADERARVSEEEFIEFLKEVASQSAVAKLEMEGILESFQATAPLNYKVSQLNVLLETS